MSWTTHRQPVAPQRIGPALKERPDQLIDINALAESVTLAPVYSAVRTQAG